MYMKALKYVDLVEIDAINDMNLYIGVQISTISTLILAANQHVKCLFACMQLFTLKKHASKHVSNHKLLLH